MTLSDIKIYCKATVAKAVWHRGKGEANRSIAQRGAQSTGPTQMPPADLPREQKQFTGGRVLFHRKVLQKPGAVCEGERRSGDAEDQEEEPRKP